MTDLATTTKEAVKKAHKEGCMNVKNVLVTLYRDIFKEKDKLKFGDKLINNYGDGLECTFLGYGDDPEALAFFETKVGWKIGPSYEKTNLILAVQNDGEFVFNNDNGWFKRKESNDE
jgi:hypothetical protein